MTDIPLTPRPQVRPQVGQQARSQVTARVHERSALAPSSDLTGLVAGLQGPNPELSKAWEGYQADQRQDAVDQARMAEAKAPADSRDALTGAPVEVPAVVPPAFGDVYRDTYRNLRTQRASAAPVHPLGTGVHGGPCAAGCSGRGRGIA